MEFLKACTSNVHAVENVPQTRCFRFTQVGGGLSAGKSWARTLAALSDLRSRNTLCISSSDGLWVFAPADHSRAALLAPSEHGFTLADTISMDAGTSNVSAAGKPVRDLFLDAVEASITFKLASQPGVVHAGPWRWMCLQAMDAESAAQEALDMRLRADFTNTGALYLAFEIATITVASYARTYSVEDDSCILLPQATPAKLLPQGPLPPDDDETWKATVRLFLKSEGIVLPEKAEWRTVQPLQGSPDASITWPLDLCLPLPTLTTLDSLGSSDNTDWRRWFNDDAGSSFRSPLAAAEEWFRDAAERSHTTKEPSQLDPSTAASHDPHTLNGNSADANIVTSSPFAQRVNDQQTAVAGIYPTPPDGLTQGTANTQLTSEAGIPGLPLDPSMSSIDLPLGDDISQTHARDSIGSAFQQDYTIQTDDLFGDRGEEMELGDNTMDDVDFSFFDEPDDEPTTREVNDSEMIEAPTLDGDGKASEGRLSDLDVSAMTVEAEQPAQPTDDIKAEPSPGDPNVDDVESSMEYQATSPDHSRPSPDEKTASPKPEKPLSPFGIRERLLPPPVPASFAQADTERSLEQRRSSSFAPVKFKDGFNLGSKYAHSDITMKESKHGNEETAKLNISLPRRKKHRQLTAGRQRRHATEAYDSESEEDSYESSSPSERESELPPKLPWETKKRKRYPDLDPGTPFSAIQEMDQFDGIANTESYAHNPEQVLLAMLESGNSLDQILQAPQHVSDIARQEDDSVRAMGLNTVLTLTLGDSPRVEDVFDLSKQDLIYIAQIIGEPSIPVLETPGGANDAASVFDVANNSQLAASISASLNSIMGALFPTVESFDLSRIALAREAMSRPAPSLKLQPGQPRPLQRSDSMVAGPDYFPIPSPYVRIQRGTDNWEMLPSCLSFWETLGLGPAGGPKNVRAFCVFPSNNDLQQLVEKFMVDVGAAYENCKLGSHIHRRPNVDKEAAGDYTNGMALVELGDDLTLEGAFKAYAATCIELGKALAHIGQNEADRHMVVYLLNPFQGSSARQLLCACFWMLFKAYRDNVPKLHRNQGGDVVLQLLSMQAVVSFDGLAMHQANDMAMLAREVYDRCPPSASRNPDVVSALPILAAPSVELASPAPKRIGFQLSAEPPADLLHEGSNLHLAYARSADGQWLTAAWVDSSGQHFASASYCLRGRSFADTAAELWERTREILAARQVMWRVFIVTPEKVDKAISQCWRALSGKARRQAVCVTLVALQPKPILQLTAPSPYTETTSAGNGQESTFLTPASTPQGNTFTNSPDVSGQINAPPTPAPSESAVTAAESNDADAHLTDLTDDTWAMLLSPRLFRLVHGQGLATGVLFKRGEADQTYDRLPSLGMSLLWTVQVKPNGSIDEGSVKQAELTLREVLRMYRNLTLLTKARGLNHGQTAVMPLHVAAAMQSARQLNGMLSSP